MTHSDGNTEDWVQGEYIPSALQWVRDQIDLYERTAGQQGNTLRDTGIPVVLFTMRGAQTGKVRKIALMRVEHDGEYALVASYGGSPKNPVWYHNLIADNRVYVQDGDTPVRMRVREVSGDERQVWWDRSVAVFPNYAEYQGRTDRLIPVLIASRVD
jgi:F420H(2)-dependent quinone reductase